MAVNSAAVAPRISYTDPVSLNMARRTLPLVAERRTDYRLGPEDVIQITIFEWEVQGQAKSLDARVEESGTVVLPVLGEIRVGGLTVQQVKAGLEAKLVADGILKAPRVSVTVQEYRSKRVAVVGAVREPGVYTLRQNVTTLLSVLTLAGGLTERAGQVLYVIRGVKAGETAPVSVKQNEESGEVTVEMGARPDVIAVDLFELMELGRLDLNAVLEDGDVVNVPEAMKFFVIGFVARPGGFPLTRPTTVLEGIALAGGIRERTASPRRCALKRYGAGGEQIIPLDLVAISEGRAANLYLQPNDVIDVRQTLLRQICLETLDAFRSIFNLGYTLNRS